MKWLSWLLPDLLTARMNSLTVAQSHWLAYKLGVYEGLHDWLEMCPCFIDLDLGDADLEDNPAV